MGIRRFEIDKQFSQWYLLRTKFKQENRASRELSQQGINCFLPILRKEKLLQRKIVIIEEPLFPQYIFILVDPKRINWTSIKSTRGVSNIVVFGSEPTAIDDDVILEIRKLELLKPEPLLKAGQPIKIIDGPLKDLNAIYSAPDGNARSFILINFIQKNRNLIISNDLIQPA